MAFKWGKKPEENNDQSKAEADALIEAIGTSLEERFKPRFDVIDKLNEKFGKLEEEAVNVGRSADEEARRTAAASATPEEKDQNEKRALLAVAVQANARITESELIADVAQDWPNLVPELRQTFASISLDRKAAADYPQLCKNTVDMLVGRQARAGGVRFNKDTSKFFVEDAAGKTGGADSPYNDPDLTWSDDRNGKTLSATEQLAKLKIDPEKFAQFMKNGGRPV